MESKSSNSKVLRMSTKRQQEKQRIAVLEGGVQVCRQVDRHMHCKF